MFLINATNQIIDGLLAVIYPQACAVCQASVESRYCGTVCDDCWQRAKLFAAEDVVCWKCGVPSLGRVAAEQRETVRCRRCDEDAFTNARACGAYEGALRAAVLQLKSEPNVSRRLLNLLSKTQQSHPLSGATLIVPVPLHPTREKVRGFNQACVIGRKLAQEIGLPFDDRSVVRIAHSERHRAGMDAPARRSSVANAFTVRSPRLLAGEKILLVDDVFTTGATASACAQVLIEAGAVEVLVLTIARAGSY